MAGTTGLEPAASAVTGQRSNQLNYVPTRQSNHPEFASVYAALHDSPTLDRIAVVAEKQRDSCPNRPKYPNSFPGNAKDPPCADSRSRQ
jgi:hypothetical protein